MPSSGRRMLLSLPLDTVMPANELHCGRNMLGFCRTYALKMPGSAGRSRCDIEQPFRGPPELVREVQQCPEPPRRQR